MSSDAVLTVLAAAGTGTIRWPAALRDAGGFDALVALPPASLRAIGLDEQALRDLRRPAPSTLRAWRQWLAMPGHALIPLLADDYPPQLAAIADPPIALWCLGARTDLLAAPQLAIVGSRRPTAGGVGLAREFAASLAASGITITSGLAAGIDAAAHAGALKTDASTVAVLGCGIDRVYPRRHATLAAEVAARGLLVSEYPPGTPPRAFRFPERNRIIAGLALGTLVVEAAARSGSLITARLAGDYGREVFAVPGSVRSAASRGCHRLLRSGACLVETAADVIAEIAPALGHALASEAAGRLSDNRVAGCDDEANLLKHLDFSPATIEMLAAAAGLTTQDVSSMLLHLELEGTVEALPGGRYCRLSKRMR